MVNDIWHDPDGRRYRIVRAQIVSYPRSEMRTVNGRRVLVALPPVEYTIARAQLIGDYDEII